MHAPIHPNVAALALNHLELRGKQDEYGKFRLWGSIGFIVATMVDFKHRIIPDEISVGGMCVDLVCSLLIPELHGLSYANNNVFMKK